MKAVVTASAVGVGIAACLLIFAASILPRGQREVGRIESAQGIPFPALEGTTTITQTLAHADVFLREPVVFKQLTLSFEFRPITTTPLAVGVRENSFWLSYRPVTFFSPDEESDTAWQTATVNFPLTDKLQEADRSIDVMFIAGKQAEAFLENQVNDPTLWEMRNLRAAVSVYWPSRDELKDYIRSVLYMERAL